MTLLDKTYHIRALTGYDTLSNTAHTEIIEFLINKGILTIHRWEPNQTIVLDNTAVMHGCYDPFNHQNRETDFVLLRDILRVEGEESYQRSSLLKLGA